MTEPRPSFLTTRIVAPIAIFIALVVWAFASPIGASPDEDYHLASIWCSHGFKAGLCEEGGLPSTRYIPEDLTSAHCYKFQAGKSAECTADFSNARLIETERGSFTGSYPPVFYWVMGFFVTSNSLISVLLMRIFNSALLVFALIAIHRFGPSSAREVPNWIIPMTFVPLGMFIVPSVNPSSWAVISALLVLPFAMAFLEAERLRSKILLGVITAVGSLMGAGARGDAAAYALLALILAAVLARRSRMWQPIEFGFLSLTGLGAIALFLSAGQSGILSPDTSPTELTPRAILSNFSVNIIQLPQLWFGAFGTTGLGWLDTPMPALVWASSIFVFSALTLWGLRQLNWKKSVAMAALVLALISVPMYIFVHDQVTVGTAVQARYILPLIIMFASVVLLWLPPKLGLNRAQLWTVLTLMVIANSLALLINMRRYLSGLDVASPNLYNGIEWWWSEIPPPMVFWVIGSLSFAVYVAIVTGCLAKSNSAQQKSFAELSH